jgi:hypothetical protein
VVPLAGLGLAQEGGLEACDSSYLASRSRQDRPEVHARLALIRRPLKCLEIDRCCLNRWRAGMTAQHYTRQQEIKL